jgi:hypothetical protein
MASTAGAMNTASSMQVVESMLHQKGEEDT